MSTARDPYFVLSDVADELWDLHQSLAKDNQKVSEQARSMYEALENIYLEPIRRSKVKEDTGKYKTITANLKAEVKVIDNHIRKIDTKVKRIEKVSEYAKIFDKVISAAAKFLA